MNEFNVDDKVRYVPNKPPRDRLLKVVDGQIGEVTEVGDRVNQCYVRFKSKCIWIHIPFEDLEPAFEHGEKVIAKGYLFSDYLYCCPHPNFAGLSVLVNKLGAAFVVKNERIRRPQKTKTIEVPVSLVEESKQYLKDYKKECAFGSRAIDANCFFYRLCKVIGGCDD